MWQQKNSIKMWRCLLPPSLWSKCIWQWPDYFLLICTMWRSKLVRGKTLHLHHQTSSIHCKNIHSDKLWLYSQKVNVFDTGVTLPGYSEVSLAATALCHLKLRTVLGSSSSKYCCHCRKVHRQATHWTPVGTQSMLMTTGWVTKVENTFHNTCFWFLINVVALIMSILAKFPFHTEQSHMVQKPKIKIKIHVVFFTSSF